MKIETYLSPNCSELGLMITSGKVSRDDIINTLAILKKHRLDVEVALRGKIMKDVPPQALASLILLQDTDGVTNVDKIMIVKELRDRKAPESVINSILNMKEYYDIDVNVVKHNCHAGFLLGDGCSGEDGILFMIGDCDYKDFPLLHRLSDIFNGEVYTIDGGHSDGEGGWDDYVSKHTEEE